MGADEGMEPRHTRRTHGEGEHAPLAFENTEKGGGGAALPPGEVYTVMRSIIIVFSPSWFSG